MTDRERYLREFIKDSTTAEEVADYQKELLDLISAERAALSQHTEVQAKELLRFSDALDEVHGRCDQWKARCDRLAAVIDRVARESINHVCHACPLNDYCEEEPESCSAAILRHYESEVSDD